MRAGDSLGAAWEQATVNSGPTTVYSRRKSQPATVTAWNVKEENIPLQRSHTTHTSQHEEPDRGSERRRMPKPGQHTRSSSGQGRALLPRTKIHTNARVPLPRFPDGQLSPSAAVTPAQR